MPSSVCIKFILYHQKWRKLPLRISSETSFFSRQHKLPALVDIALHFPQKHQSSFPLQPLVFFQLLCIVEERTSPPVFSLLLTVCSKSYGFSLSKNYQVVETTTGGVGSGTLFKKWRYHRCFPVSFAKFVRTKEISNFLLYRTPPGDCFWSESESKPKSKPKRGDQGEQYCLPFHSFKCFVSKQYN